MKEKTGIGIVTFNRPEFFSVLLESLPDADEIVVVNDGNPYDDEVYSSKKCHVIQHKGNKGVGRSKNDAMKHLLSKGCKHIFVLEDDIKITDTTVFEDYIKIAERTGLQHLNYVYHGILNLDKEGKPRPRGIAYYDGEPLLSLNEHIGGAFSYFTSAVLERVGLIDPLYYNAWEHVDHTYRITQADGYTPFWWFADVYGSEKKIADQDSHLVQSVIRKKKWKFMFWFRVFARYYRIKHGYIPYKTPDTLPDDVKYKLERIFILNKTGNRVPEIILDEVFKVPGLPSPLK
ncbi:MAG: glycosyltransferase [Ignavibacteriaceae bacterium]|nr:glycosyltransferase [Ignavibacteriaceae bacterium]